MTELIRKHLLPLFAVDLRTLALFRISLGAVLSVTSALRLCDLRAFYTDDGVLPRGWLFESDNPWRVSLHFLNGGAWLQALLICAAVLASLALMAGWRTRLAAILSWTLAVSVASRNPLVLTSGDDLLVCLLFWSMFLPLGARYSVDAALSARAPPRDHQHLSWAGAGLLLQVMSVYFFSALRTGADGAAAYDALSLDSYATHFGRWLLNFPDLLQMLSNAAWWLQLLGPVLVFTPLLNQPLRFIVMLMFMAMNLGFLFCLELGPLPFAGLAGLSALLGGWFWDWAARRGAAGNSGALRIFYDRDCGYCLKTCMLLQQFLALPKAIVAPAQDTPRAKTLLQANHSWVVIDTDDQAYLKWPAFVVLLKRSPLFGWLGRLVQAQALVKPGNAAYDFAARHRGRLANLTAALPQHAETFESRRGAQRAAAVFVFAVLAWNLGSIRALPPQVMNVLSPMFYALRLDQAWNGFAPSPGKDDGWYVAPGVLADGSEVDVLRPGRALSFAKPGLISQEYRNIRWHAYQLRNYDPHFQHHRQMWARYLCREWNSDAEPPQRLLSFKLIYMLERTLPGNQTPPIEQRVLWRQECPPFERPGDSKDNAAG